MPLPPISPTDLRMIPQHPFATPPIAPMNHGMAPQHPFAKFGRARAAELMLEAKRLSWMASTTPLSKRDIEILHQFSTTDPNNMDPFYANFGLARAKPLSFRRPRDSQKPQLLGIQREAANILNEFQAPRGTPHQYNNFNAKWPTTLLPLRNNAHPAGSGTCIPILPRREEDTNDFKFNQYPVAGNEASSQDHLAMPTHIGSQGNSRSVLTGSHNQPRVSLATITPAGQIDARRNINPNLPSTSWHPGVLKWVSKPQVKISSLSSENAPNATRSLRIPQEYNHGLDLQVQRMDAASSRQLSATGSTDSMPSSSRKRKRLDGEDPDVAQLPTTGPAQRKRKLTQSTS